MIIFREKIDEEKKIYKYVDKNNKLITDKEIIDYITKLVIPPAYNDVEVFYEKSPKILFQGIDANGRLQQIYSPKWRASADKAKFKALIDFGHALPKMTLDIMKLINSLVLSKEKIIAIILRVVQLCGVRIGQAKYQKLYGSIGLSTLMKKHLTFKKDGKELHIKFPGKKGVINECMITDKKLIQEIERYAIDKTHHELLFTYWDNATKRQKPINAIDVNDWLKEYNPNFTTKFFRTMSTNAMFIDLMKNIKPESLTPAQRKKKIVEVIKELSCSINNTPSICKKSYLDPELVKLFLEKSRKYQTDINNSSYNSNVTYIKFLEKIHK